jgi:replicative DNA helicase
MSDLLAKVPPGGRADEIHAAEAVLGSALIDAGVLDELLLRLMPDDFYMPGHASMWQAMSEMHRDGLAVDAVTLFGWMSAKGAPAGIASEISRLTDKVPTSANAAYYADTVQRTADLRRLVQAAADVQRWAFNAAPRTTPGEVQKEADRLVRAVLPDRAPAGADLGAFAAAVVDRASRGEQPIVWATGFRDLDERLGGGVRPGQMTLIAARPSMGKTAFMTRAARNIAWSGVGVSFFSLEMDGESVAQNMLAAEVGLPGRTIGAGALTSDEWNRVRTAVDYFRRASIRIYEGRRWRWGDLVASLRHDVRQRKARVVVIDYLQLIDPDEQGRSRAEEVGEISRELKLLALDLGISVIAAAQLSREVEKRRDKWPIMSDLRESGNLEQDADNILLLHRPEVYEPEKQDLRGLAHINVVKQRNGPPGVVDLRWEGACMRFSDVPSPEEPWQRAARERAAGGGVEGEDA